LIARFNRNLSLSRCLAILAVLGLLASQLAAMPHGHAGMTSEGEQRHNATPHFHFGSHADHAHGHSHHGHSQPHPTPLDSANLADDLGDQQPFDGSQESDHDHDAIYVSELDITNSNSAPRVTGAELSGVVTDCAFVWTIELYLCQNSSQQWHPPDKVLDASETFLTLRNLRI
jgi:hypothetical protein